MAESAVPTRASRKEYWFTSSKSASRPIASKANAANRALAPARGRLAVSAARLVAPRKSGRERPSEQSRNSQSASAASAAAKATRRVNQRAGSSVAGKRSVDAFIVHLSREGKRQPATPLTVAGEGGRG